MILLFKTNHKCGSSFIHLNYWLAEWERERDTIIWLLLKTEHSVGGAAGFDREEKKRGGNRRVCLIWIELRLFIIDLEDRTHTHRHTHSSTLNSHNSVKVFV